IRTASWRSCACSTPFAIMEFCGSLVGEGTVAFKVLNAFRHHGVLRTIPSPVHRALLRACSTPFGIMEFCGLVVGRMETELLCAQRLSASWSFAAKRAWLKLDLDAQRLSASWSFAGAGWRPCRS